MADLGMIPDERAELDRMVTALHDDGYRDIDAVGSLRVGARVRHVGHQWPDAYRNGTGVVVALTERPDSAWSRTYGGRDIELVALWDKPHPFDPSTRLSQLANYHAEVIDPVDWHAAEAIEALSLHEEDRS